MVSGDERGSSKGKAAVRKALVGPWEMKDSLMVIGGLFLRMILGWLLTLSDQDL
jgi:hypothetical protein